MLGMLHRADLTLGPLLATFLLGFTTLVLLVWYSYQKQSYWKRLGLPQVKPYPFIGSIFETFSKPLHDVDLDRLTKFGRIYGHYEGNKPLISIAEPEIIRQILIKDFNAFTGRRIFTFGDKRMDKMLSIVRGEDWKRIRTIVTPTFTTGKIKRMVGIFKECSRTLVQNFKKSSLVGEPVEIKSIYSAFTMDIIASSAFSTKLDSHNDPNNQFVLTAKEVFTRNFNWRFLFFFLFPGLVKLFKINIFSVKALNFFSEATLNVIEERRKTGQTRNDFLQLLLDTSKDFFNDGKLDLNEKDDIAENYGKEENDQIFKQNTYTKKNLSHDEVIAQCVLFFLAGFETTASALSFASYCLAVNPDIQEKLIQEIDDALRDNNGELTYEAIQSMKYLDNVISETLRLYPPALRLERAADVDYKLGDIGITIPKGMVVSIPTYAIHRDPSIYTDPEKFDPDRFTPEERAKRDQYAYLPFGAGPRNCVAMRFALMEAKVCLAHVMSNFRLRKCPETKVPLEFCKGQGFLQPKDIMLSLEVRTDTATVSQD